MEFIKKDIENENLKSDGKHLMEFQKEIRNTYFKTLDELHIEFVEKENINDIESLEILRKFVNFMKNI